MEPAISRRPIPRGFWIKVIVCSVLATVGAALLARGFDWRAAIGVSLAIVRDAGPWAFFGAMAVLPAVGFPLSPFTLGAGPAFGATMGIPAVIAATWAALLVNVMISYTLARWLLRPWLERLVLRMGYRLPEVRPDNQWDVAVLLRVTPGPPFFVQSFLLGLARVPVRVYLVCSLTIAWAYAAGFVLFGDALLRGRGRLALGAASLLVAFVVAAHLVRKYLARRKAPATP